MWLLEQGCTPKDVVRAVWGIQRRGRTFDEEQEIVRRLKRAGKSDAEALEGYRKRRPHKSAQSMIRTARNRYNRALDIGPKETDSPVNSDPVSRAITRLLRDVFCEPHVFPSSLVSHAQDLRTALLGPLAA
ncbi:MAG: hypothetical protein A2Z31_00055 [candidate division NC10 bacterium RBG_16_65_8]|nr:MAG: hypothetical protein A2Z31_00055 [candidate division NC10 bacterium RBG_16_65_8]